MYIFINEFTEFINEIPKFLYNCDQRTKHVVTAQIYEKLKIFLAFWDMDISSRLNSYPFI